MVLSARTVTAGSVINWPAVRARALAAWRRPSVVRAASRKRFLGSAGSGRSA
jgi:hypothetical protein